MKVDIEIPNKEVKIKGIKTQVNETYTKEEIDYKDSETLNDAKQYTDDISLQLASKILFSIDPLTYILDVSLLNEEEEILNTASIDLPLEEMIVSIDYDDSTKEIIFKLKSGETRRVPIGDIIEGLQIKITPQNKLSADLVDDTSSLNKFVSIVEKEAWNGKEDVFSVSGHLKKSNENLSSDANKNYQAVYNNGELSRNKADYPGIQVEDHIEERIANNYYKVHRVYAINGSILLTEVLFTGFCSVTNNLTVSNTGNQLYAVDSIIFTRNDGRVYRCTAVSDDSGEPPTYTYTWQEVSKASKIFDAVMSNGSISYDAADYPGITVTDIAISRGYDKLRIWYQANVPDEIVYWQEMDYNDRHVYEETTAPPTTVSVSDELYHIAKSGDIYIAKINNVVTVYMLKVITQSQTRRNFLWENLSDKYTKAEINGLINTIRQLPVSSLSDAGKFLRVDTQGNPYWDEVTSAESEAY